MQSDSVVFVEYVEEVQVWLESDKNNWYFPLRPVYEYIHDTSLNSS